MTAETASWVEASLKALRASWRLRGAVDRKRAALAKSRELTGRLNAEIKYASESSWEIERDLESLDGRSSALVAEEMEKVLVRRRGLRWRLERLRREVERKTEERDREIDRIRRLESEEAGAEAARRAILAGATSPAGTRHPVLRFRDADWRRLVVLLDIPSSISLSDCSAETPYELVRTWELLPPEAGSRSAAKGHRHGSRASAGSPAGDSAVATSPDARCRELFADALGRLASGNTEEREIVARLLRCVREAVAVRDGDDNDEPIAAGFGLETPPGADSRSDLGGGGTIKQQPKAMGVPRAIRAVPEIGGRRGGTAAGSGRERGAPGRRSLRPELICREAAHGWGFGLFLSAPPDLGVREVLHDGVQLVVRDGSCEVPSCRGSLVTRAGDGREIAVPLFEGEPLIFRTAADWSSGRNVRGVGHGHFLVVAPEDWRRLGDAPVEPAPCGDGFLAHCFHFDEGRTLDGPVGFHGHELDAVGPGFSLSGIRVFDDCAEGDLFRTIPSLSCAPGVREARVGFEGDDAWLGDTFDPNEMSLEAVLAGREGRFYVRVYDDSGLRDSGQFRLLRELREIRMNGKVYCRDTVLLPHATGHRDARVELRAKDPRRVGPDWQVRSTRPAPVGEEARWRFQTGTGVVNVVVQPPRVWWRLCGAQGVPDDWRVGRYELKRQDFQRFAEDGRHLEVRLPRGARNVRIGFDATARRKYAAVLDGQWRVARAPLRDFRDYVAVARAAVKERALHVRIGEDSIKPIRIWDEPPPPAWMQPRPNVWRQVGYSPGELREAGLTVAAARRARIPIDERCRCDHSDNVDRLRGWLHARRA